MLLNRFLVAMSLVAISVPAAAQVVYEGCTDINGVPVASIRDDRINDIAMAAIAGGQPVIFYNVQVLAWVRPPTRRFFYAHECAHHRLGHIMGRTHPLAREQEADCWAVRVLVGGGSLSDTDVTVVQRDIARMGREDWVHLPGSQRAINLRSCIGTERSYSQRPATRSPTSTSEDSTPGVDSLCESSKQVVREASAAFRSLHGERDEDGDYRATIRLTGAYLCTIDPAERVYTCLMGNPRDDHETAAAKFDAALAELKACFGGSWLERTPARSMAKFVTWKGSGGARVMVSLTSRDSRRHYSVITIGIDD
jgi:hypothetical protein